MNKEMKWGLAILLLLLGIAAVFIFLDQNAELRQLEKETAESDKLFEENAQPPARPGYKVVPHGDHFHEVPIDAPDTWQEPPHGEVVKDGPVAGVDVLDDTLPTDIKIPTQSELEAMSYDRLVVVSKQLLAKAKDKSFPIEQRIPYLNAVTLANAERGRRNDEFAKWGRALSDEANKDIPKGKPFVYEFRP